MTAEERIKLEGIEPGANKYIHPETHPASMITETSSKRFVSDAEKANWNAKETPSGAQAKADTALNSAKAYTDQEVAEVSQALDAHKAAAAPHSGHETPTGAQAKVDAHANRTDNPHSVTKSQVGLGNVENYEVATQKDAEEGTATNKYMTPQRTKQAIDSLQAVKSVAGKTGIVTLSKSDVGLSNVDNVQQASKAEFDSHNQDFTRHITEEERTAWNNKTNLTLGETSSTAYRGDRGKIAYDHSQTIGNPHQTTKADMGLGNVENYGIATQAEAEAGSVNNKYMTPLRVKQAIDVLQAVKSVAGKTGNVTLTKDNVGLSNVDNVKQASKTEFDSHNNDTTRHITAEERTRWNNKAEVSQIPTKVSELENDKNYVTQDDLGSAGYGDMMKAIYDSNGDGKVDVAETVIGNEITLGDRFKIVYNDIEDSLDFEVI
jgi:methylphosphotriester-DNA--protein-cysteine methyltransferase